jgi:hypothetical protein
VKLDDEGAPREPNKSSLLAKLWAFAPSFPSSPRRGAPEAGGEVSAAGESAPSQELKRLPSDWPQPPAPEAAKCKVTLYTPAAPERIEFLWAGEASRHVGTVVHRWLQRIAEDALDGWTRERIGRLRARFRAELRQRGVPAAELERAAERVAAALGNSIADERGRWVLGPHPEATSEYRLRTAERRYVVDRVFTDASGARWVVDFKASSHGGTDLEGFLDSERERYRAQLDQYAAALGGARRGLYFPLLKGWREW